MVLRGQLGPGHPLCDVYDELGYGCWEGLRRTVCSSGATGSLLVGLSHSCMWLGLSIPEISSGFNHFTQLPPSWKAKQAPVHFQSLADCSLVCRTMDSPPGPTGKKHNRGVKDSFIKSFLSFSPNLPYTPFHCSMTSRVYHLCACLGSQPTKSLSFGLVLSCHHLEILNDF